MNEKFRSVISHSSDDKIKVAYSWYGPKGPIWNTELPNILMYSAMAEGVNPNMESRHFWCDDLWTKLFSKHKDLYEIVPLQYIEHDDLRPCVFPYSLTWRIPFQTYFNGSGGILEFSHMPGWFIHMLKFFNCYILLDHAVEAYMSDQELESMYSYFHHKHNIPMYKIMYMTGSINGEEIYNKWADKNNIPNDIDHRMKIISYASSRDIFSTYLNSGTNEGKLPVEPEYDVNYVPEKLFLTWNRRYRRHRIYLGLLLEQLNLIDKTFISFPKYQEENSLETFDSRVAELDRPLALWGYHGVTFSQDDVQKFSRRLPLVIDGETDINKMCEDFNATLDFYQRSLVSLITETNYDASETTLTEKSFKPLLNKHPFIILGRPGVLKGLRDMGFKTFDKLWDESYDQIQDPGVRLAKIAETIKDIASWSPEKILEFKANVKPILEHNYQTLKEFGSVIVGKQIYNHITDHFETGLHYVTCEQVKCWQHG